MKLTTAGKEELALALLLWKDFKANGKFDPDVTMQALRFAKELGVMPEFEKMLSQLPPMKVVPR